MKNSISFKLWGKYALFTDPVTKIGGEKCSYQIPTYEAIKGVLKSIYWKPTIIWYVDRLRAMKPIRTQPKGMKPVKWTTGSEHDLAIYTYLYDVEYQVEAHFEWNLYRPELEKDRIDGKHYAMVKRSLEKGGRQDIYLGARDCPGYVEPQKFGEGSGAYDDIHELSFGMMIYGFDYPDETGNDELRVLMWNPVMKNGIVEFPRPADCPISRFIRHMKPKQFQLDASTQTVTDEVLVR